ncbi:hypothetical protein GCM10027570_45440 [Streptomonospora sediminis]
MRASVGVDIGGTFTDIIVCPEDGAPSTVVKTPSTPRDPGEGMVHGLRTALDRAGVRPAEVGQLVHGTTVGTNAVLEQAGARIGIITTAGFEDVLNIGRAKRTEMYDLFTGPDTPDFLCPRSRVAGVAGRMGRDGTVVEPLDEDAAAAAIDRLVERHGVEAIAVSLLFSFTDPAQERRVQQLVAERHPHVHVSLSSRVDPRFREFERLVVTAMDAYIRPKIASYVRGLRSRLADLGVAAPLQIMESHGGIVGSPLVEQRAVGTLLSGLAGGANGAAAVGTAAGRSRVIGFDMGGTSTDVTLITDGRPVVSDEGGINGHPLRVPMVDVHTIGAGGGSIAYVDEARAPRVGPHSAGADPGPAAYGRGGTEPTVTDANLLLGFLGGDGLAGGTLHLDPDLAEKAMRTRFADPLGMSVTEAAWGVHRIAGAAMSAAVRIVSVARGHDPRQAALIASGGAGALHACTVAEDLGITDVLVPPHPGVLSAYGLLAADLSVPRWRTFFCSLTGMDPAAVEAALAEVRQEALDDIAAAGADPGGVTVQRAVDARYAGQSHELTVEVGEGTRSGDLPELVAAGFNERHQRLYGQHDPDGEVEITAVRATATATRTTPNAAGRGGAQASARRRIYVPERDRFEEVPVLPRPAVREPLEGPAVLVQEDSTVLIRTGWTARPGAGGILTMSRGG